MALAEIDVGAQRVQRHAALAIPLHARDLGAAEAAAAVDPDALRAQAHRRLHRALHGAAEGDAALELLGDVLGDQLGVDLGLADLDDVEADLAAGHAWPARLRSFSISAPFLPMTTPGRAVWIVIRALLGRPLDHDRG